MNPFRFVARVFIDVFGITRPDEQQEKRAAWFICGLLALIVAGMLLIFLAIAHIPHH